MRKRVGIAGTGILLLAASIAQAQPVSASDITTRGRPLEKILKSILVPDGDPERSVLLVIDPSNALRFAGFPSTLRDTLRNHEKDIGRLRLGIASLDPENGEEPLPPGSDLDEVRKRAFAAMASTRNVLRDVYTPLKDFIPLFAREPGLRTIVLFSQQNGDTEYKLEKVIAALVSAKIRVVVVTREVTLSDDYWYSFASREVEPPARAYLGGSEAAFVEIPHGWIHQDRSLTAVAGSGFATWGLSRLAAGTGGGVEILYTSNASTHRCAGDWEWSCTFCNGSSHVARDQSIRTLRLKAVEPSLEPRRVVLKEAGSDPYYKAALKAWRSAYKRGLARVEPTVRSSGGGLAAYLDRERDPGFFFMEETSNWPRAAQDAKNLAGTANHIATQLRKAIAAGDRGGGSARYRAIAELTYVMLRLTRLNLLYLEAFYRDVAPKLTAKRQRGVEAPETEFYGNRENLTDFYVVSNTMSLCHGVRPFFDLKLPGGNDLDVELRAFAVDYDMFLKWNAYTPYLVALSHMGIARFELVGMGKANVKGSTGPVTQSPRTREKDNTATARERDPERGERGTGSTSGGSDAPTSGG